MAHARLAQAGNRELARLLKGLSKTEASTLFSKAAQKTAGTAREDILNLVRWHQREGHTVILASGGFQPFVAEVADLLGIGHAVGTALEEVGRQYTDRLAGPVCHGDNRARLLGRFIETSGFDVNLSSSYAYGDRVQDVPMLEMVGYPVAVYPDNELLTYASERGWRVVSVPTGRPPKAG